MPRRRTSLLPILLTTTVLAAGCGSASKDSSGEQMQNQAGAGAAQVAASDVAEVIDARQKITTACDGSSPRSDLIPAVQSVVTIVKQGPSDRFETGNTDTPQTMTSVALDLAGALDKCGAQDLGNQLRAVATGAKPVQKGSPGY